VQLWSDENRVETVTASDVVELATRDPLAAVTAIATLRRGNPTDLERVQIGYALGLAERETGNIARAAVSLRTAIADADALGAFDLAREIRTSLAPVLILGGDAESAFAVLDEAATDADEDTLAVVECQRAGLYVMTGAPEKALERYAWALPTLDQTGNAVLYANGLANRGVLFAYLGRPSDAQLDFTTARTIYVDHGHDIDAADMTRNLGFAAVRHGDIPAALAFFDEAERGLAARRSFGTLGLDRAEALLAVGLAREAARIAGQTAAVLERQGDHAGGAEGRLLEAQAAAVLGEHHDVERAAAAAAASFATQGRVGWAAVAQLELARSRFATGTATADDADEFDRVATSLEGAGQSVPAVHARLLAARTRIRHGLSVSPTAMLSLPDVSTVDLSVHVALAEAEAALAEGRRGGAAMAIDKGLHVVRRAQASLGATDTRAHVATYAAELSRLAVRIALDDGDALAVLRAVERGRAGALQFRPVVPPNDRELSNLLDELRAVVGELRNDELSRNEVAALSKRQAQLETSIRNNSRQSVGNEHVDDGKDEVVDLDQLQDALGDTRLISFGQSDTSLFSVVVDRSGIELHHLPIELADLRAAVAALRFRLDRAAAGHYESGSSDDAIATMLAPLLGDAESFVVVPIDVIANTPLRAIAPMAGRPFTIAPSVASWRNAKQLPSQVGHTLFAAGPRLDHADAEVIRLGRGIEHARTFDSSTSTVANVAAAFPHVRLAHLACHGTFRDDNPLLSTIELADGPLTVYDIERLARTPEVVVLSACDAAMSARRPGDELLGLSAALFPLGTRSLIASTGLVPDADATLLLMETLHSELRSGQSPARALATAQRATDNPALAGFTCYGAGFV
jgi:tetratricopeptide (TPR) repeat protein